MPEKSGGHVAIISVSWDTAVVSFSLARMSHVTIENVSPEKAILTESVEKSTVGRLSMAPLSPETEYEVVVRWEDGSTRLRFATLPAPRGPLLCSFAAVADTHVSLKPENRKGRLFMESASILLDLVEKFNRENLDFVLIAGDLTDMGTPQEYETVAAILEQLTCPCLAVPGDHDVLGNGTLHWQRNFGQRSWCRDIKGYHIIGIDTSRGALGADGRAMLEANWRGGEAARILVSHHQLFPDDYISGANKKSIADFATQKVFLKGLFQEPVLVYAGHQNVPSRARMENALQVNLPQPVQFPCGYLLVRQYSNGFYHTFTPIHSAVLDDYSRVASEMAAEAYGEPQWREAYRAGKGPGESNFLHPLPPG